MFSKPKKFWFCDCCNMYTYSTYNEDRFAYLCKLCGNIVEIYNPIPEPKKLRITILCA